MKRDRKLADAMVELRSDKTLICNQCKVAISADIPSAYFSSVDFWVIDRIYRKLIYEHWEENHPFEYSVITYEV